MKKIKNKILFCLIILLIAIIAVLIYSLKYIKNVDGGIIPNQITDEETNNGDETEEQKREEQFYVDKITYINIKECLNNYVSGLNAKKSKYYGYNEKGDYTFIVGDETINGEIYNLLSNSYINKKGINTQNVRNYVYKVEKSTFYTPIKIDVKFDSEYLKAYGIYGVLQDLEYNIIEESYLILNIDKLNQTFSVEQLSSLEELKNIKVDNVEEIAVKENNQYGDISGMLDEAVIKEYVDTYKSVTIGNPEIVYNNFLDEEYRNKKFGSLENYKKYVEENKETIIGIDIQKFNVEDFGTFMQYVGIDQNNKYYIFNAKTITDYTVLLDTYTVDTPQFTEKYNQSTTIERAGYNIQKCIDAINDKDYSYVYSKLSNGLKNNYYKTEESFVKVIKEKLFNVNKVNKTTKINEGDTYIYNLIVLNAENEEQQQNMTVIMQLKEGTDFVMSFSFDK